METQDVRWKQRFQNFLKALALLGKLDWNVLKDYFEYQGDTAITD